MALSTLDSLRLTVAALRQRTGESQRELAAAVGLTQDKVSRRQSGAQPWSLDEVDILAAHWGMAPLDLLAGPTHAAQSLTWPPGTAAPTQPPPVPAAFTPSPPAPVAAPGVPAAEALGAVPTTPSPAAPAEGTPEPAAPRMAARTEHTEPTAPATPSAATGDAALTGPQPADAPADYDRGPNGEAVLHEPAPCVCCGRPAAYRVGGRPLHLGGFCAPAPTAVPQAPAPAQDQVAPAAPAVQQPAAPAPASVAPAAAPRQAAAESRPAVAGARSEYGSTGRDLSYYLDMITGAVEQALEEHEGDTEAASDALEKKAIPNGMALFEATRVGAAYEHTAYPERLEFLSKKSRNGADEIWEGRHKWENAPLMAALKAGTPDHVNVDVLDTNAAYCSALKTHLPIGSLVHRPDGGFDPKRSGIYLLPVRPAWEHPHLPDPIGNRHEAGPVLLDDATVRLLTRCHKLGLCEAPHITEAWTSGASEGLLEKFRRVLTQARENAIADSDQVTEKYVKAMYAKFASTIGESTYNREIRRPDWMHIIRSQAFANLWYKAHRAHKAGLTIVRLRGTDELHVTGGEWRKANSGVFDEGRLTTQLKLKDQYTLPLNRKRSA
ncbi:acyltransferase [Kitasatospora acidiphila]|uniref:helix-turn-helix domain-containing protein n=1 Tax=Kitasatospora acidiphila TaxID=2567942 RepID=UPI003C764F76